MRERKKDPTPLDDAALPTKPRRLAHMLLFDLHAPAGRAVALFIQALILYSLLSASLETFPNLPNGLRRFLYVLDDIVILLFTVEYALRLWAARHRWRYALSIWGLIDLAAIAPFWIIGADVASVRAFRLLRLVHVFRFGAAARAMNHFAQAWRIVRNDVLIFLSMAGILIYLTALAIWHFEHVAQPEKFASIFEALWWAVVSLTTVGYGDAYPVTVPGRLLTMLVLLLGIGVVAVPSGLLASAFQEIRKRERQRRRKDAPSDAEDAPSDAEEGMT